MNCSKAILHMIALEEEWNVVQHRFVVHIFWDIYRVSVSINWLHPRDLMCHKSLFAAKKNCFLVLSRFSVYVDLIIHI